MQHLYQRFQPAQFSNYKAPPKKTPSTINQNVSFAHVTKGQSTERSQPHQQQRPPNGQNTNELRNRQPQCPHNKKTDRSVSWSDDVPPGLNDEIFLDQTICPTPSGNLSKGTKAGGSMHDKTDDGFQEFVKQQFNNLNDQMLTLLTTLTFTVK
jgi:hypothetical protein